MSRKNYYSVLAVARDATTKQLKERFRALAREKHPDRFSAAEKPRAEEVFQAITEAFNILSDPIRRRQHNEELERPEPQRYDPLQAAKVFISRGLKAYRERSFLEAASNFNRAVEINPHNAQGWHQLALTAIEEEHWLPKSREAIERAMALEPSQVAHVKLAGRIYEKSGMASKAREHYLRARTLGADDPTIAQALGRLGGAGPERDPGKKPAAKKKRLSRLFRKT